MQDLLVLIMNKAPGSKLMVVRPGYPLGAGFGDCTPEAKGALFESCYANAIKFFRRDMEATSIAPM
jgi:hypothetical protein